MLRALVAAMAAVVAGAVAFVATVESEPPSQGGWFAYPAEAGHERLEVRFATEATAAHMAEVVAELRDDGRIQSVVAFFDEHRVEMRLRAGASRQEVMADVISIPLVEDISVAE